MAHLIFQTAFPGDLLLSTPLLRGLRRLNSDGSLVLACRPGLGDFFLNEKLVDEVIELNKASEESREAGRHAIVAREWESVICPHESLRTHVWMKSMKACEAKVGFKRWWNGVVFDQRVSRRRQWPDALRQLSLLTVWDSDLREKMSFLAASGDLDNFVGIGEKTSLGDGYVVDFSKARTRIPDWASMTLRRHQSDGQTIYFAPGSVWPTKRWTEDGYVALGQMLVKEGFSVALVGSGGERELCERIAAQVGGSRVLAGKTSLTDIVDLFSTGAALVTNDSGAMHMASVAGLPTVAIFGPTTLELGYRPWQNSARVVQLELGCRPCGKHGARVCPIGTHRCMAGISASSVREALRGWV